MKNDKLQEILEDMNSKEKITNLPELIKTVNAWIEDTSDVITWNTDGFDLKVIAKIRTNGYSLYRLWPMGGKWIISVDLDAVSPEKMFDKLLKAKR